jgi:1-acyl-sn-glycerol-3-phosphate acyltransferase
VIRSILMLAFWGVTVLIGALIFFPLVLITRNVAPLYRYAMWLCAGGMRIAGVRAEVIGRDQLDLSRTYIFMANHTSNLDPPLLLPLLPRRTSVLVKKELFRVPLLGWAMRMASLVAVDRKNRDAAIESVRRAAEVLSSGLDMTVFPEGTRSPDGELLPFKKGPFHLAMETGVPVVPITIVGTQELQPKGSFAVRPGRVRLMFHPPLEPQWFPDREALMNATRVAIASALTA